MKLEYTDQASRQDVLSVDDVKAYLRIEGDEENAVLASLIAAAQRYCEDYQHRTYGLLTLRLTVPTADAQTDIELPRSKNLNEVTNLTVRWPSGKEQLIDNYTLRYGEINTRLRVEEMLPADADLVINYRVKGECDESTLLAMRLLVASWYENRLAADDRNRKEAPFAVTALLNPGRVLL